MKRVGIVTGLFFCLAVALIAIEQRAAAQRDATPAIATATPAATPSAADVPVFSPQPQTYKKCSFSSDCRYGKCKKSRCGGCSFSSDCKGWGKCKSGWCGGCSFSSDCKGFGGCKSGHCKKSPY